MAEQVADGVVWGRGSRTNFYVVAAGDGVTLVDTGYPGDFGRIVEALAVLDKTPADVDAVLLTHAHIDHIGSAELFRTDHDAPVHAHRDEVALARGEREERISNAYMVSRLWWPKMVRFVLNAVRSGATKVRHVTEVVAFDPDRGPLDLPGGPMPVFTPGHTSGHCGYHLHDRGVLLTGDALVMRDDLTMAPGPRLLSRAFNHDHAAAVRSLEHFRLLDADTILPGHGPVWRGSPAAAVEAALAMA